MDGSFIPQEILASSFGYLIVFGLMIINGALSFPSSQVIYIISGILVGKGALLLWPLVVLGGVGNALGNMIVYALSYKYGEPVVEKYFLIHHAQVKAFQSKVQKHGLWLLFVGKLTPSIKVVTPLVTGLAKVRPLTAFCIFTATSLIWAYAFLTLGKLFGSTITMSEYALVMGAIGVVIAFYFYKNYIKPLQNS